MKANIFLVCISLFLSSKVYCNCDDIAENIEVCKVYSCMQSIDDENYTKHSILGLNHDNLCIYIEENKDNEMICYHSKHGMMMERKYFSSIFLINKQDIYDFTDIANLRSKECFFVNDNYSNHDDFIKQAVDSELNYLSEYNDTKSIFFDEKIVNPIIRKIGKFNIESLIDLEERTMTNFDDDKVRLDSIIYFSPDIWRIWINGKIFQNTKDLKVHAVTENYVTFIWTIDRKISKKQMINSQNLSFDNDKITFTLYPRQEFDLNNLFTK
ncbi:MAG: hypothetical protein KTV77_04140 [Wolbachia endosymbiont of Fragariocoptes setiger]|nr:hypothetical protein [Wolbachia endosymbiont of Fragariocoptes setiger]